MATLIFLDEQLKIMDFLSRENCKNFDLLRYNNLASVYTKLKEDYFKILILDVDNDRFQLYKNILKSNGFHNHLSILALTSDDSLENIRTLKESNINEIIIKPVDRNRFNRILLNIIDQRDQI